MSFKASTWAKSTRITGRGQWGAQVIALGEGKFTLVGYEGGLPGEGWKRTDRQETAEGKTEGGITRFQADQWVAEIKDGVLTVSHIGRQSRRETEEGESQESHARRETAARCGRSVRRQFGRRILKAASSRPDKLLTHECSSKQTFGDHKLHLEFCPPFKPLARGQARGNSGVYVQSRYEVQVLDSFGLEGENNECGGIYSIAKPIVNMCYPPLTWQTYDIEFTAARYENDKKVKNARITVVHNGVKVLDDVELPKATPGRIDEGPGPAPLFLQGHGNPVVFRNIWVVEKEVNPRYRFGHCKCLWRNSNVPCPLIMWGPTNHSISQRSASLRSAA